MGAWENRPCKDCLAAWREAGNNTPLTHPRPASPPGPRCATHMRDNKRTRKALSHARRVQRTYGLQEGEYDLLYQHQGQHCAICQRATGRTRMLSVDHCHATNLVRGLLCRPCNTLLGHMRDDPSFFRRAIAYLENPPAQQLGLMRLYNDGGRADVAPESDSP